MMILPCPFCGNQAPVAAEGNNYKWCKVTCSDCGASSGEVRKPNPNLDADNKENMFEALSTWNERHLATGQCYKKCLHRQQN